ncbi:MAG: response regulator [Gemmataceae bacterium]|nr:response regulator [Gemmataceae bacterium]
MAPSGKLEDPEKKPRESVLIIEDEVALAEGLAYNLRREGYDVSQASDGKTGLAMAMENPPDVVLLDMMLPVRQKRGIRSGGRVFHGCG